mmetsp:Transcript_23828/g.46958  ORF Transcript_23828/g.46958 Transcript_23828/m.46958 type:complete len:174 (-) Transcript_23828:166-687(-)
MLRERMTAAGKFAVFAKLCERFSLAHVWRVRKFKSLAAFHLLATVVRSYNQPCKNVFGYHTSLPEEQKGSRINYSNLLLSLSVVSFALWAHWQNTLVQCSCESALNTVATKKVITNALRSHTEIATTIADSADRLFFVIVLPPFFLVEGSCAVPGLQKARHFTRASTDIASAA